MVAAACAAGQRRATGRPPAARNDAGTAPDAAARIAWLPCCRATGLGRTLGQAVGHLSIRREMRRVTP
jgi:hypothetical protein